MQKLRREAQARIRRDECLACIMGFHDLLGFLEQQGTATVVAEALALDAAERLQSSLHRACEQMDSNSEGDIQISTEGVLALLEVLAFWHILVADHGPLLPLE